MKNFTLKTGVLTLALMFALPVFSQVTLKYNFKKGDILKQNMSETLDLSQKIMEQESKVNVVLTTYAIFEVKDVKDAKYTLEMKYKEVKVNTMIPGIGNILLDSNVSENIATIQNLSPVLKAVVDKPVEIVVTATGKVESIKGVDKIGEAMLHSLDANINDATKQQLISQFGVQFSEKSISSFLSQNEGYFSSKPVNTGDSWNCKISSKISNIEMDIDMKITVKSIEADIVTLDAEGTLVSPEGYEIELNGMKAKATMKGSQKGWVKIDKATGWVVSSTITQTIDGNVEALGINIPMSINSTISVSDK
ncbi:MAG: DUF6263 family protein [Prevotellaceae bacterium]|jgi:hypothetical protein|nr:DUF6263 family protein [Prevotellaceae bacterium]